MIMCWNLTFLNKKCDDYPGTYNFLRKVSWNYITELHETIENLRHLRHFSKLYSTQGVTIYTPQRYTKVPTSTHLGYSTEYSKNYSSSWITSHKEET